MVVVPRLFEVLRTRIIKSIEKQGRLPNYLMDKAIDLASRRAEGKSTSAIRCSRPCWTARCVPRSARFGGRMKALVSGGAPLNPEIGLFFQAMGLTLLQGYGQTECAPVAAVNRPSAGIRMDTVGPPLHDTEIRIAEDGEILVRGELVMHGYWRNDAETAKVLKIDPAEPEKGPWLHTGDIGLIDPAGRIKITDRKRT
jgi:long-chain acyl-CoA synthetase